VSFAEIVLRLGVAFVGWIVIYMHLIGMLVVRIARCPGSDMSPWKMTMATALLTLALSFALTYGHRLRGANELARYTALPLLPLLPWAVLVSLPYLTGTTFGTHNVCDVRLAMSSGVMPAGWERAWAPLQLAALVAIAINGWRVWRLDPARED